MNKFLSFLAGVLIGGGVAALVTIFMAPLSGQETRQAIADTSIELKERVQDVASQTRKSEDDIATEMERELNQSGDNLEANM